MKKLIPASLMALTLTLSTAALAHTYNDWYGKEGQDEKPYYMDAALSKLPPQKAADFRKSMKEADEENKDLHEKIYTLHGELHEILTAPTFNKHAFISKRKEIDKLRSEMEESRTDAFASAASELSQGERVTLTRSLDHAHSKKHAHYIKEMKEKDSRADSGRNESIQH